MTTLRWKAAGIAMLLVAFVSPHAAAARDLPPPTGPAEPKVEPIYGDDKLYHQSWFVGSFLNLREDFEEARKAGKRFAIIFEQRGCGYCIKMHKEVFSINYINTYIRNNFNILQLNLWGDREVTDFDGKKMPEKALAERWNVIHTPTIFFFPESLDGKDDQNGGELMVTRTFGALGPNSFYDFFVWVRNDIYQKDKNFQRFHVMRYNEREALKKKAAPAGGAMN